MVNKSLSVREIQNVDIENIVDYFINSTQKFLNEMAVDKNLLPEKDTWIKKIQYEISKDKHEKEIYYVIWMHGNEKIGHSSLTNIIFGKEAKMHLHLWKNDNRKKGLGLNLLKKTILHYFSNFELENIYCEPFSENPAPNRILLKIGFDFLKKYKTTPGITNYPQVVNRYRLSKDKIIS